ncbi:DUF72 domain-containing protein [Streptomyces murinus]|uniref:DUF72 domain-containing protein n=1 Tax=Streptomyces murinus TaxID=33900 RepID=UPI0018F300C9|nr:DUF72 domain-containing protein [Streptomyces murinus]
MANILIGTCGWTDRALLTSGWYPPGHRDTEGRLRHYATRFPLVEADSPYYALPTARTTANWAERTPDGFRFDVKAPALLTGHPTRPSALPEDLRAHPRDEALLIELWARYADALAPLRRADRLGTLLFQYPPSLGPGPDAETFIRTARERARGWPFAVEFRNPAWWQSARTLPFLTDLDATAVSVDAPTLPPTPLVTTPRLSLVRFHGRSPHWGTGTKEDRFRHTYTPQELSEWLPRIHHLATHTDELHLLFNNCCGDSAAKAAETMRTTLHATPPPHPRTAGRGHGGWCPPAAAGENPSHL